MDLVRKKIPRQWCIQGIIMFLMWQYDSCLIWETGGFQVICELCRTISKIQQFNPSPIKVRKTPNNFTSSIIRSEPKLLQDQGGNCSSILCFKLGACYVVTWENCLHSWFWEDASTLIGIHAWKFFKDTQVLTISVHNREFEIMKKNQLFFIISFS